MTSIKPHPVIGRQERRVRPGASSSVVAAGRVAECLDCSPSQQEVGLLGKAIHFGIGMAWGLVYGLLRRHGGLGPFGAALASGAIMALILDEGVVPVLGLSAPNRDYPVFTHARAASRRAKARAGTNPLPLGASTTIAVAFRTSLMAHHPRRPTNACLTGSALTPASAACG